MSKGAIFPRNTAERDLKLGGHEVEPTSFINPSAGVISVRAGSSETIRATNICFRGDSSDLPTRVWFRERRVFVRAIALAIRSSRELSESVKRRR